MKGIITEYSLKNKGIKIKNDFGDYWYDVTSEFAEIFETTKKGQEIDFTYEKVNDKQTLKTFEVIKNTPAKNPFNMDWDLKKQENITKLALYNTATSIINSLQTKSFSDEEQTKRVIATAKQLYKGLSEGW